MTDRMKLLWCLPLTIQSTTEDRGRQAWVRKERFDDFGIPWFGELFKYVCVKVILYL